MSLFAWGGHPQNVFVEAWKSSVKTTKEVLKIKLLKH